LVCVFLLFSVNSVLVIKMLRLYFSDLEKQMIKTNFDNEKIKETCIIHLHNYKENLKNKYYC